MGFPLAILFEFDVYVKYQENGLIWALLRLVV